MWCHRCTLYVESNDNLRASVSVGRVPWGGTGLGPSLGVLPATVRSPPLPGWAVWGLGSPRPCHLRTSPVLPRPSTSLHGEAQGQRSRAFSRVLEAQTP